MSLFFQALSPTQVPPCSACSACCYCCCCCCCSVEDGRHRPPGATSGWGISARVLGARGWAEGQWLARWCPCCCRCRCPCPCLALLMAGMCRRLACPGIKVHPWFPRPHGCALVSQRAVGLSGCRSLAACTELSLLMTACWAEEHAGPGWVVAHQTLLFQTRAFSP